MSDNSLYDLITVITLEIQIKIISFYDDQQFSIIVINYKRTIMCLINVILLCQLFAINYCYRGLFEIQKPGRCYRDL